MELKINRNTYTIKVCGPKNDHLLVDGEYRTGATNYVEKEIYIAAGMKEDTLRYTLIHELTHAYLESYGFLQVDLDDEIVADIMANYMLDIYESFNNIIDKIK